MFWVGVGGPLVAEAWGTSALSAGTFLVSFFGALCTSKLVLAWGTSRVRTLLQGPAYCWTVRATGVLMLGFAAWFAWDAVGRLVGRWIG